MHPQVVLGAHVLAELLHQEHVPLRRAEEVLAMGSMETPRKPRAARPSPVRRRFILSMPLLTGVWPHAQRRNSQRTERAVASTWCLVGFANAERIGASTGVVGLPSTSMFRPELKHPSMKTLGGGGSEGGDRGAIQGPPSEFSQFKFRRTREFTQTPPWGNPWASSGAHLLISSRVRRSSPDVDAR